MALTFLDTSVLVAGLIDLGPQSVTVIVTDKRRRFLAAFRHGIRVETPSELLAGLKKR